MKEVDLLYIGFREGRSTIFGVTLIHDLIQICKDQHNPLFICSLWRYHTIAYLTSVCLRMKNITNTLVYADIR